jgi:hypothetical protein
MRAALKVSGMVIFGLAVIALVAIGGFWVAARLGWLSPMYHSFQVAADRAMERVEPLPSSLKVVEEWEGCGQGGDPMCDSVVLLIDDPDSESVPQQELVRHLERNGWAFEEPTPRPVMEGSLERDRIEVTSAEHEATDSGSWELDSFLSRNDSTGLAHLTIIPWKE